MKYLRTFFIMLLIALCIAGCKKDPKNPERTELNGKIGLKFVTPSSQKTVLKSVTNQNEEIKGMFFSVYVTAFQYSPDYGFDETRYAASGYGDWAFYVVVNQQTSVDKSIGIILLNGGEVDVAALTVDPYSFSENYKSKYDNFSIDFLAIQTASSGVFFDDVFYGRLGYWWAASLQESVDFVRSNYPELGDFTVYEWIDRWGNSQDFYYDPALEGFPNFNGGLTVLFARSDWFSESVFVKLDAVETDPIVGILEHSITWSNKSLSNFQKEKLISLLDHASFSEVIHMSNIIVVPCDGPVKLALFEDAEGMKNPEFKVSFDFTHLLTEETYNNIISGGFFRRQSDDNNPDPVFTIASSNGLPFGLSASIEERE